MAEQPTRSAAPSAAETGSISPSGDATWSSTPLAVPPPTPSILPVLPGYEVLGELGRGGMGVVYKARQIGLNRLVALKMILAGGFAGAADLERFRTEAEAIARLRHPNIVQVHEIGEHQGRPFFTLELCAGSLERRLKAAPLAPAEAAELVETLARAMEASHRRHVIHRDLKPANVLLTEDGSPKITDFGLAKKLDEVGRTQSGAVLGTPSYMAPEQAKSDAKQIGPATDVYALGAILYECLTGQPPFRAATLMETLQQVIADEPAPLRRLNARTPADLEIICLKCLQKEPGKRYGTAAALADDLARQRRGEPIAARPVGRLERGWLWCRRNPWLSGLTGAVAASLVVGAAVSVWFAVDASRQAAEAHRNETKANTKTSEADAARSDLQKTNDRLLTTAARDLLRPLAPQVQPNQPPPPLSDAEVTALWQLACYTDGDVRIRFVEEALRESATTRQLRDRAACALQAAVGLDAERRSRVERLLVEQFLAAEAPDRRQDLALILARFGVRDAALSDGAARALGEAADRTAEPHRLQELAEGLSALAPRLGPKASAGAFGQAAEAVRRAAGATTDPKALQRLADDLAVLAPNLEPGQAEAACGQAGAALGRAMAATTDPAVLEVLADGLAATAPWMGPKEAGDVRIALEQASTQWQKPSQILPLARSLAALAPRLPPEDAEAVALEAHARAAQADPSLELGPALSQPGAQMPPFVAGQTAAPIVQFIAMTKDPQNLQGALQAFLTVAPFLGPRDAGTAAAAFIQAMAKTTDPTALRWLGLGLLAAAERLDAKEARDAVAALVEAVAGTTIPAVLEKLADGLTAAAARAEPRDAAAALARAAGTIDVYRLRALALGLANAAGRLAPPEAAAACRPASAALMRTACATTDPNELRAAAEGLSALGPHLEAKDAADAAAVLVQAGARTADARTSRAAADGLSATVTGMGPAERRGRLTALASVFGAPDDGLTLLAAWPTLQPALKPSPPGLPTPQLVELLKHPLCVGEARRAVLDQLGGRYGRRFGDQWDFVEFAEGRKLDLDFTAPPRRPDATR